MERGTFTGSKVRKSVERYTVLTGGTAMCRNTHRWTHREAKTATDGPSVQITPSTSWSRYTTLIKIPTEILFPFPYFYILRYCTFVEYFLSKIFYILQMVAFHPIYLSNYFARYELLRLRLWTWLKQR